MDNEALARALPLDPGESAALMATVVAAVRSAHSGAELHREELRLDYAGPRPGPPPGQQQGSAGDLVEAEAAAAQPRLGRRATLGVEVHVQPSVQVGPQGELECPGCLCLC